MHTDPEWIFWRAPRITGVIRCGRKNRTRVPMRRKLDVLNRPQSRKQLVDLVVAENESVATTQEHIAHFRCASR